MEKDILVTKSFLPPLEEYESYLKEIWASAWLTNMGQFHERLKEELKQYLKVEGLELFTNGHLALEMILQAMNLTGEVITTPFSFASTTHAIVRNGLKPVFCDISEDDGTMDVEKLEALITPETSAIIPVHVYGNICKIEQIQKIAEKYNLRVIYDAAHTFGETYDGRGIGSFGDASMFSFHATKVFHTIEGGAVAFSDPAYADILFKLKNFGIMGKESVEYVGGNAKMNEFQAAMGLCNLKYIEELIEKRKALTEQYETLLSGNEGICFFERNPRVKYNYAYMPVLFENQEKRDEIYERLAQQHIYARKYFYPCINEYECYRNQYKGSDTPVALSLSKRVLTLPIYAQLEPEVVGRICDIILGRESKR